MCVWEGRSEVCACGRSGVRCVCVCVCGRAGVRCVCVWEGRSEVCVSVGGQE